MTLRGGCFGSYTDKILETVILTALYGFLRSGEFSTCTCSFDPDQDLTISDISIYEHHFTLLLNFHYTLKQTRMAKAQSCKFQSLMLRFVPCIPCWPTCKAAPMPGPRSRCSLPRKENQCPEPGLLLICASSANSAGCLRTKHLIRMGHVC